MLSAVVTDSQVSSVLSRLLCKEDVSTRILSHAAAYAVRNASTSANLLRVFTWVYV